MNKRLLSILLCATICYHTGVNAVFGEQTFTTMREKINNMCLLTRKKACFLYEKIKKHKKLISCVTAYLVFECVGYSRNWDTPLRRLCMPARLLNEAQETITRLNTTVQVLQRQLQDGEDKKQRQVSMVKEEMQNLTQGLSGLQEMQKSAHSQRKEAMIKNVKGLCLNIKKNLYLDEEDTSEIHKLLEEYIQENNW